MATKAATEPRYPRAITFTLHLKPPVKGGQYPKKHGKDKDDEKGEKYSKNGKAVASNKLGVSLKMQAQQINWKNVEKGDVVQFVPFRGDRRLDGARVRVKFVGKDKITPASPFGVDMIRSTSFHKVMHSRKLFCAICSLVTTDGVEHGYDTDGLWLCEKPHCP